MSGTMVDEAAVTRGQRRRAVFASTVGTSIEWYDFFLYGTAAALVFPELFFPDAVPFAGILLSFGTQFVGFAARPIGAAIFGHFGDRIGRKATLVATLLLMGIGTFLIGCCRRTPRSACWRRCCWSCCASPRVWASAASGVARSCSRWSGARGKRRGLMASWPQMGVPIGLLLSTGAVKLSRADGQRLRDLGLAHPVPVQRRAGGHRALRPAARPGEPRVRGGPQAGDGGQAAGARGDPHQPREILTSAFVRLSEQAPFYLFITFVLTYGIEKVKLDKGDLLNNMLIAAAIGLASVPFFGSSPT